MQEPLKGRIVFQDVRFELGGVVFSDPVTRYTIVRKANDLVCNDSICPNICDFEKYPVNSRQYGGGV